MSAAKSFKNFMLCLSRGLAPMGVVTKGNVLSLKVPDAVIVFGIQKDFKHSTKEQIRFTVNVGISLDALRVYYEDDANAVNITAEKSHWRSRLGRLIAAKSDVWWDIQDDEGVESLCREITTAIGGIALPQLKALAPSEAFVERWQNGIGQGLTEYERRTNLARLLVALDRKVEARKALEELEAASLGKAWAVSAKVDARELHKLLE